MSFNNKFGLICFCWLALFFSSAPAFGDGIAQSTAPAYLLFKEAYQYQVNGNLEEACIAYKKASEYDPNDSSAYIHLNLGIIYTGKGANTLAIDEYKKALQFDPKMSEAMLNLGSAYQTMGDLGSAQRCFRNYLEMPDAPEKAVVERLLNAVSGADRYMPIREAGGADYVANVMPDGIKIWGNQSMPLKVYIEQGQGVVGFTSSYIDDLQEAFNDWVRSSNGSLSWRRVSSQSEADITCNWTNDPSTLGESGVEGGVTSIKFWREADHSLITGASITLLTCELDGRPVSDSSMKRRCLHEVGHSLGLSGHSPNNQDVMFYTEVVNMGLMPSARDVSTLLKLYQANQSSSQSSYNNFATQQIVRNDSGRRSIYTIWPSVARKHEVPSDWRDKVRQNLKEDRDFGIFSKE